MARELLLFLSLLGFLSMVVSGGESLPQQVHLAATGESFVHFRPDPVTPRVLHRVQTRSV